MPITFDSVANWAIPLGVIIFLFGLFYSKFKETFDTIGRGIKSVFSKMVGGGKTKANEVYEVRYKYG